jgi:BspA type Leucine rich repeat region (6 copies)
MVFFVSIIALFAAVYSSSAPSRRPSTSRPSSPSVTPSKRPATRRPSAPTSAPTRKSFTAATPLYVCTNATLHEYNCCNRQPHITFAGDVTAIPVRALYECASLKSVTVTNTITTIDEFAFYMCPSLSSVIMGAGVRVIADYSFAASAIARLTLPSRGSLCPIAFAPLAGERSSSPSPCPLSPSAAVSAI